MAYQIRVVGMGASAGWRTRIDANPTNTGDAFTALVKTAIANAVPADSAPSWVGKPMQIQFDDGSPLDMAKTLHDQCIDNGDTLYVHHKKSAYQFWGKGV